MTKPISLLCGVSLLLNAALLFFLASGSSEGSQKPTTSNPSAAVTRDGATIQPVVDATVWPNLKTDELPTLIARLREAGFPADMIRAILSEEVNKLFSARRKALDPDAANRPFWKDRPRDPKIDQALRQLSREQQKTVNDLLGKDTGTDGLVASAYQNRQLDGVPAEKRDEVQQLLRDYNEKRSDAFSSGVITPADRAKLVALDKEQHEAMSKILSPTELAEYDVRASNTANMLRYELTAFNPTEQEFRELYAVKRPFDEQYNNNNYGVGQLSQDQIRQRTDAQKQLNEQIKATLGPERAAEYERATDYNYRQASQLVARLDLPPETTNQLWEVQKDIQQRTKDIYADNSVRGEDRTQKLATLAEEAKTRISASLGAQGFEAYKQYGGQWMQQLTPRKRPQ